MNRPAVRIALWSGLAATLAVTAYLLVNTTFMPYDDEGFVLISLRNYLAGLRLYDDVFSQYGPWPYVYHELVTKGLHSPMTHALGRMITIFHWVAMALLCGALGWRLTRSHIAAFATAIIVFGLTWQNTSEPTHPGSHIALLVALAAVIVSGLPDTSRPWLSYAALGVIASLLLLTKINVGLLFVAGLGCFVLRYTPWSAPWGRIAMALAAVGLLAIPWVLLGRQLGLGWVLIFAIQFTLAAAGLLWVTPAAQTDVSLPRRIWMITPLSCLIAGSLICFHVWQRGTTLDSLINAVLINPLRMPANFLIGPTWYPATWCMAVAGALAVGKAGYELRRHGRPTVSSVRVITGLRCATLLVFVIYWRQWPSYSGIFHFAAYCLPLLAVFLVPLTDSSDSSPRLARWGAACVALPQILHAFPVAGSQLAWGTFLCVPILVAGMFELRALLPGLLPATGRHLIRSGAIILIVVLIGQIGLLAHTGWQRYTHSRPLNLPGAGDIRVDDITRQSFRLLNLNASIHADLLFSRQGMFSHNIWSGIPTPTAQNATHWFWLLDETRQQEIISALASTPRTALIVSRSLDGFFATRHIAVTGPLQDFVQRHYRPLYQYGDFIFNVPVESHAIAFGRYELLVPEDAASPTILFRTCIPLDGRPAQIRLEQLTYPWEPGPELLTNQAQAVAEPIDREGRVTGRPVPLPSNQTLRGLYRLSVICPRLPPTLPWPSYTLVVRDQGGALLSESVH